MKKYRVFCLAIILLLLGNVSCSDFLDQTPPEKINLDAAFKYKSNVAKWLTDVYSYIPNEWGERYLPGMGGTSTSGVWQGGSSETEYAWDFPGGQRINLGTWSPSDDMARLYWKKYYAGIRAATTFLQNIDKCTDYIPVELAPGGTKMRSIGEARALRAIFYYYLIRIYGPVILLNDEVIPVEQADYSAYVRAPFDECVEYIISELDEAEKNLQDIYPDDSQSIGRIDQRVTRAFKTQVLLLAASPLFNGNEDYALLKDKVSGVQLISQTREVSKWKRAADSLRNFIVRYAGTNDDGALQLHKQETGGNFDAYLSNVNKVLGNDIRNKEKIFIRTTAGDTRFYEITPRHDGEHGDYGGGSGALGVTQQMVDLYYMANGKGIEDPTSGYPVTNSGNSPSDFSTSAYNDPVTGTQMAPSGTYMQWVNREPRFYADITFNKQRWINRTNGDCYTNLEQGGNSGWINTNDYSKTGYIQRKYVRPNSRWNATGSAYYTLLRLGKIYLDYAEALNECDPGNADILKFVNFIRKRAGIPELTGSYSQAEMQKIIRREKKIELAFEAVHFFETRRWKTAEETEAGPFMGLNIYAKAPQFYTLRVFESRVFLKKHYLFPIPQAEINKCANLVQNTGW